MIQKFVDKLSFYLNPGDMEGGGRRQVFVALILLLPVVMLMIFGYFKINEALTRLALRDREVVAASIASTLEAKLDKLVGLAEAFAVHGAIQGAATEKDWDRAKEILSVFNGIAADPFINRIFLADPSGVLRADFPDLGTAGQDFSYRDWYRGVVAKGDSYVSEVYRRQASPQLNVVAIATPVKTKSGDLAGIFVLQVDVGNFLSWLNEINIGGSGSVYVVDQTGSIVANPSFKPQEGIVDFSSIAPVKKVLKGESGTDVSLMAYRNNKEVVSAYSSVRKYGWGVIVEEGAGSVFWSRNATLALIIFLNALILASYSFLIGAALNAIARTRR